MQPTIGITLGTGLLARENAETYSAAVREAGGEPVLLGSGDRGLARECKAIVFTGGRDVHPAHYRRRPCDIALSDDEVVSKYRMELDTVRDGFELPMARVALEAGVPLLGICRGFQLLNVALGGGMVPDLKKCVKRCQTHSFPKTKRALHEVTVHEATRLASLVGAGPVTVNSYHHQGVTELEVAPGLVASATCCDGVIEAIEMPGERFLVLVQWHPERRKDPEVYSRFRPLFEAFIAAASV